MNKKNGLDCVHFEKWLKRSALDLAQDFQKITKDAAALKVLLALRSGFLKAATTLFQIHREVGLKIWESVELL